MKKTNPLNSVTSVDDANEMVKTGKATPADLAEFVTAWNSRSHRLTQAYTITVHYPDGNGGRRAVPQMTTRNLKN